MTHQTFVRDVRLKSQANEANFVAPSWQNCLVEDENVLRDRIAASVEAWMKHAGLSVFRLSERSGVGRQTIYDLLKKTRLTGPDILLRLATEFGTTPGTLLDGQLPKVRPSSTSLMSGSMSDERRPPTLSELSGQQKQAAYLVGNVSDADLLAIQDAVNTNALLLEKTIGMLEDRQRELTWPLAEAVAAQLPELLGAQLRGMTTEDLEAVRASAASLDESPPPQPSPKPKRGTGRRGSGR